MRNPIGVIGPLCRWARAGVLLVVSIALLAPASATAAAKPRVVPSAAYPTIQSAVRAAQPGDQIHVLPGTYREQLSIDKSVTITGSGPGVTTIAAPKTLVAGADGNNSIVEIRNGASVAMSLIGVSGPGAPTSGTSGPAVVTEQCCGFTATASRQP